ncbi:hypothetical protein GCM10025734_44530 [Kitasatospora paranensis]
MLTALAVLAAVRLVGRRPDRSDAGPAVESLAAGLRWTFTLFLVPALAIRYGVGFGHVQVSGLCALALLAAAAAPALRGRPARVGVALAAAAAAGLAAAAVAAQAATGPYYETALLAAMAALLVTATATAAVADRVLTL